MDRSWMTKSRLSQEYRDGVEYFLKFAEDGVEDCNLIRCPCNQCENIFKLSIQEIIEHLFFFGINQNYTIWIWHGENDNSEESPSVADKTIYQDQEMDLDDIENTIDMVRSVNENIGNPEHFQKLLEDAEKPLYNGCKKYIKLSAIVKLYNIKAKAGWSDKSFTDVLALFADMLPEDNELPLSAREAKRSLFVFGMECKKIHAYLNDCILYRNEYKNAITCPTCGIPRYKVKKNMPENIHEGGEKGVPSKVFWYFPPIQRFKRWFQYAQTGKYLTWHVNERQIDGQLRHPADSPTWKLIDNKWPEFGYESRNLRLSISTDGINPYSSLSSKHSSWPVMLSTYNLPSWLCMKRKFIMLTMLIYGPKQPGDDIDVYLAPLINDLKTLWENGVKAYDAHKQEYFTLKAVLLWTISDFPAYGNLSGCVTKGYHACPICDERTYSHRLKNCHKCVYTGHRRYLPQTHSFRKQRKAFNGEPEFGWPLEPLSGEQILMKVGGIKVSWGKKHAHLKKSSKSKKRKKPLP